MSYYVFVFIALGVVIPLAIISRKNSNISRIKRQLKNTPLKQVAEVKDGENIQIRGTVEMVGEPIIAPLSGRICGHYCVTVEQRTEYMKSPDTVHLLIEEESIGKYLIKDGDHYAYVPNIRLISRIVFDKSYSARVSGVLEKKLRLFMEKYPDKNRELRTYNTTLEFKEGILELKEKVIVSGIGNWKSAVSLGFPPEYGRILYIEATPDAFSVITDDLRWLKHTQNGSN